MNRRDAEDAEKIGIISSLRPLRLGGSIRSSDSADKRKMAEERPKKSKMPRVLVAIAVLAAEKNDSESSGRPVVNM